MKSRPSAKGRSVHPQSDCPETFPGMVDKFHLLFNLTHEVFLVLAADGAVLEANETGSRVLGYARDELATLCMHDLLADEADETSAFSALRAHGALTNRLLTLRRKDGVRIECLCSFSQLEDPCTSTRIYCAAIRDVTLHRRVGSALQESEERYRSMFVHSHDALALVTPEGLLLAANPSYLKLLGYTGDDVGKVNISNLYVEPDGRERFLRRMGEQGSVQDEVTFRTTDGRTVVCARTSVEHRDASGRVRAFQSALRDVTELKKMDAELSASHARTERMLQGMVLVIEQMTERRDAYTAGHQRRVAELSVAIARRMGLPEDTCVYLVNMAARVHDIGKIAIPAEILSKPGGLTEAETALIQEHSRIAFDILSGAELPYPVAESVLQHHERLDGSGYPRHLGGDDILPEARILAVADVVEAMSSHRPYRPSRGTDAALAEIASGSASRYDPDVVTACLELFRDGDFAFAE